MNFKTNTIYSETIPARFGRVQPAQLATTLQDGRTAAFLVIEHLLATHKDLRRVTEPDYPESCVRLSRGRICPVRMVTAHGCHVNLHRGNGCCRKFNRLEHLQLRAQIHGYILVDVSEAPKLTYAFVNKIRVPETNASFSHEDGCSLISLAGSPTP